MSYLDFFLDFAVTGRVFGVGVGDRPDDWSAVLGEGTDFLASEHELARQFGLIDAYFDDASGSWLCHRISVRVGESYRFDDWVPATVRERYGQLPGRVPFDAVVDHLGRTDLVIDRMIRSGTTSMDEFWLPQSGVMFWVLSPAQADSFPALRVGDVWAVGAFDGVVVLPERAIRYWPV